MAEGCRFRDCTHNEEPGCAVRSAVATGALQSARLDSYHKLIGEAQVVAMKAVARLRAEEDRKSKISRKAARDHYKRTDRG